MLPARRWLAKALPLLLIASFAGGAAWLLHLSSESRRLAQEATRLADAKETLASFAEIAAKRDMPAELAKRFDTLTKEAADPKLIELVQSLNTDPKSEANKKLLDELNVWISRLPHAYGGDMVVESWFVQNKQGTQIARSPQDSDSYLKDYWYRDYFHGQGKDLDKTDLALRDTVRPNDRSHLSCVYPSTTSGLLKVAFSVPIWRSTPAENGNEAKREVIGVLAMSMNVHDFTVLEKDMAGGSEVVLIDLRNDWVEGEQQRGLILHHPRLEEGKFARVNPDLLKAIDEADPLNQEEFHGENFFQVGYQDPLSLDPEQKYWGVFEPVRYAINGVDGDEKDRFGWIVLVQKPIRGE